MCASALCRHFVLTLAVLSAAAARTPLIRSLSAPAAAALALSSRPCSEPRRSRSTTRRAPLDRRRRSLCTDRPRRHAAPLHRTHAARSKNFSQRGQRTRRGRPCATPLERPRGSDAQHDCAQQRDSHATLLCSLVRSLQPVKAKTAAKKKEKKVQVEIDRSKFHHNDWLGTTIFDLAKALPQPELPQFTDRDTWLHKNGQGLKFYRPLWTRYPEPCYWTVAKIKLKKKPVSDSERESTMRTARDPIIGSARTQRSGMLIARCSLLFIACAVR